MSNERAAASVKSQDPSNVSHGLAEELLAARLGRRTVEPPSNRVDGFDLDGAYRVAAELDRRLCAEGYGRAGVKIGFTNRAIWPRFGLDEPILSPVYDRTVLSASDRISLRPYCAPRLEVEVVFGISGLRVSDVGPEGAGDAGRTPAEGDLAPTWVALGFEIVDCHYAGWHLTPEDSVADFGLHGALVVGPRLDAADDRFERVIAGLAGLEVRVFRDGEHAVTGHGRDVLGHPLAALEVVPGLLERFDPVEREDELGIVSTGTMTALQEVGPGQSWRVEAVGIDLPGLEIRTAR